MSTAQLRLAINDNFRMKQGSFANLYHSPVKGKLRTIIPKKTQDIVQRSPPEIAISSVEMQTEEYN